MEFMEPLFYQAQVDLVGGRPGTHCHSSTTREVACSVWAAW